MAEYGRLLCAKLNRAKGPVSVFAPLRGFSDYDVAGGVFHDPEANEALLEVLRSDLAPHIELVEIDTDINDSEFAEAMARRIDVLFREWSSLRKEEAV